MVLKTVSVQERIEGGEVSEKMGLQDGTREESMCLVTRRKWTMRSTTVHVWKVGVGGGVVVVGGERAVLTTKTKEGRGTREGGVSLESKDRGEEIGSGKVGGGQRDVCLTTAEARERRVGRRGGAPGVAKVGG